MKKISAYMPIILVVMALTLAFLAKSNEQAAAKVWKGVVEQKIESMEKQAQKPSHQDVLGLRNLVALIAKSNGIPVTVVAQGETLNVMLDLTQTTKEAALENDQGLYQFLYTVAALPYRMRFTKFDLGQESPSGLDFAIQVEGI